MAAAGEHAPPTHAPQQLVWQLRRLSDMQPTAEDLERMLRTAGRVQLHAHSHARTLARMHAQAARDSGYERGVCM